MTPEEFKEKMLALSEDDDVEKRHYDADRLMCDLLTELGYGEGIKIFDEMPMWWA